MVNRIQQFADAADASRADAERWKGLYRELAGTLDALATILNQHIGITAANVDELFDLHDPERLRPVVMRVARAVANASDVVKTLRHAAERAKEEF